MPNKKTAKKAANGKPLEVTISIDATGAVQVTPDCLSVEESDQRIRWKLDAESRRKWRLVGTCWCGDGTPPDGEFHEWLNEKDRVLVTDRNQTEGSWRYGLLYKLKKAKKGEPPRVFDPVIRNQPPH